MRLSKDRLNRLLMRFAHGELGRPERDNWIREKIHRELGQYVLVTAASKLKGMGAATSLARDASQEFFLDLFDTMDSKREKRSKLVRRGRTFEMGEALQVTAKGYIDTRVHDACRQVARVRRPSATQRLNSAIDDLLLACMQHDFRLDSSSDSSRGPSPMPPEVAAKAGKVRRRLEVACKELLADKARAKPSAAPPARVDGRPTEEAVAEAIYKEIMSGGLPLSPRVPTGLGTGHVEPADPGDLPAGRRLAAPSPTYISRRELGKRIDNWLASGTIHSPAPPRPGSSVAQAAAQDAWEQMAPSAADALIKALTRNVTAQVRAATGAAACKLMVLLMLPYYRKEHDFCTLYLGAGLHLSDPTKNNWKTYWASLSAEALDGCGCPLPQSEVIELLVKAGAFGNFFRRLFRVHLPTDTTEAARKAMAQRRLCHNSCLVLELIWLRKTKQIESLAGLMIPPPFRIHAVVAPDSASGGKVGLSPGLYLGDGQDDVEVLVLDADFPAETDRTSDPAGPSGIQ